jgi:uncharacterized protein with HEPN domain
MSGMPSRQQIESRALRAVSRWRPTKTTNYRSAVERQFEIVGEALRQLRDVDPDAAAAIPELARIVAFRNILIHGYASVDDRLVWGVVEGKLPALRIALGSLLKR